MGENPQFHMELLISSGLIAATTFVHAIFIAGSAAVFRASARNVWGPARFVRDSVMLAALSLWLMAAHVIAMWMWAITFIQLGIYSNMEAALYFAAVSYTTLGFGDVLLPEEWRLLAGASAANGLLLFGLSAAFMVETNARLRLGDSR